MHTTISILSCVIPHRCGTLLPISDHIHRVGPHRLSGLLMYCNTQFSCYSNARGSLSGKLGYLGCHHPSQSPLSQKEKIEK